MSGAGNISTRLAELSPGDRQWLYGQLSENERLQLFELLAVAPEGDPALHMADERLPGQGLLSPENTVANARPWEIVQALLDEPDWTLALLFSRQSWPWLPEYLESLEPARAERLRALAAAAREASRDKAYLAAVGGLASQLRSASASAALRKANEVGVARLMETRPIDD
jgi:hypothetical protein